MRRRRRRLALWALVVAGSVGGEEEGQWLAPERLEAAGSRVDSANSIAFVDLGLCFRRPGRLAAVKLALRAHGGASGAHGVASAAPLGVRLRIYRSLTHPSIKGGAGGLGTEAGTSLFALSRESAEVHGRVNAVSNEILTVSLEDSPLPVEVNDCVGWSYDEGATAAIAYDEGGEEVRWHRFGRDHCREKLCAFPSNGRRSYLVSCLVWPPAADDEPPAPPPASPPATAAHLHLPPLPPLPPARPARPEPLGAAAPPQPALAPAPADPPASERPPAETPELLSLRAWLARWPDAGGRRSLCHLTPGPRSWALLEGVARLLAGPAPAPLRHVLLLDVGSAAERPWAPLAEAGKLLVVSDLKSLHGRCDLVAFSADAGLPISVQHVVRPLLRGAPEGSAGLVFDSAGCGSRPLGAVSPETPAFALGCESMLALWRDTATLCGPALEQAGDVHRPEEYGGCFGTVCACRMPWLAFMDPTHVEIDCQSFARQPPWPSEADREAWRPLLTAGQGQWHQDWYLWHRLFAPLPEAQRTYVDVGAGAPFFLSGTASLDQCLGWRGLCVEPNPRLWQPLQLHRSCELDRRCVAGPGGRGRRLLRARGIPERASLVARRGGAEGPSEEGQEAEEEEGEEVFDFEADCTSLADVLRHAGLARPARIDVLSLDVEHEEVNVLRDFQFQDFDIAVVVVDASGPVTARALDALLLPAGFAKVAALGLDAVYAHGGHLAALHAAGSPAVPAHPPWVFREPYEEPFLDFQRRFVELGFGEL